MQLPALFSESMCTLVSKTKKYKSYWELEKQNTRNNSDEFEAPIIQTAN